MTIPPPPPFKILTDMKIVIMLFAFYALVGDSRVLSHETPSHRPGFSRPAEELNSACVSTCMLRGMKNCYQIIFGALTGKPGKSPRGSYFAIPIALYRPQIGPLARNGKKMGKTWILAPPGKRGKNGRKMGRWPFLTHFWAIVDRFFGHFFLFPGGAKIHVFAHFFPISGRRPDLGSVQGNRDRNSY